ncbi:MAG: MerR family transcriptional regulator, partial [Spirochaetaceae bacterium]|nr:MerR family transcriptional regulator [Spirochaetaceae bacterium]
MKIYQVEELVGITKKNIRFYEDQGLLCPSRNP